jgi:hypothetical protein
MRIKVRLLVVGLKQFIFKVVGLLCEKCYKSNVCAFQRAAIEINSFRGKKTVTFTFSKLLILFSITGRVSLR